MPSPSPTSARVVIVGAGIIGLAHAIASVRRGFAVTVVDRDGMQLGASVRNFGHICVTAQAGDLLELGRASRVRWREIATDAGIEVSSAGAVAVARSQAEFDVLAELAEERGDDVELVSADEIDALLASTERRSDDALVGGARLGLDLRVDPRTTVGAITRWLGQRGVEFRWREAVHSVDSGSVLTSRGRLDADLVIVCTGHDLDRLLPDLASTARIERCVLAMTRVAAPAGLDLAPAVLTGTSMLRYDGFARTNAAALVRAEISERAPDLLDVAANVMFTQRPDGTLIVGDTHEYGLDASPFLAEEHIDLVLTEAAAVLGVPCLRVLERWRGVYASSPAGPLLERDLAPGVAVAVVTSGIGMTVSMGLGERTLARLTGESTNAITPTADAAPSDVTPDDAAPAASAA